MTTRDEHLAWCKRRAHEYLDHDGDVRNAITSMMSDLGKHPETTLTLPEMNLAMAIMVANDQARARQFIDGFV